MKKKWFKKAASSVLALTLVLSMVVNPAVPSFTARAEGEKTSWNIHDDFPVDTQGQNGFRILGGDSVANLKEEGCYPSTDEPQGEPQQWKTPAPYAGTITQTFIMSGEGVSGVKWTAPRDGKYSFKLTWDLKDKNPAYGKFTGFEMGLNDNEGNTISRKTCAHNQDRVLENATSEISHEIELKTGESVTMYMDSLAANDEGGRGWWCDANYTFEINRTGDLAPVAPEIPAGIKNVDKDNVDKTGDDAAAKQQKWNFNKDFPVETQGTNGFSIVGGDSVANLKTDGCVVTPDEPQGAPQQWKTALGGTIAQTFIMPGAGGVAGAKWTAPADGDYAINLDWAFDPDTNQAPYNGFDGFEVGILNNKGENIYKGACVYANGLFADGGDKGNAAKRVTLKKGESVTLYVNYYFGDKAEQQDWFDRAKINTFEITQKTGNPKDETKPDPKPDPKPEEPKAPEECRNNVSVDNVDKDTDDDYTRRFSLADNFPLVQGQNGFHILWGTTVKKMAEDVCGRSTDAVQWKGGHEYSTLTPTSIAPGEGVMGVKWVAPEDGIYAVTLDWKFNPDGQSNLNGFTGFKVGMLDKDNKNIYNGACAVIDKKLFGDNGKVARRLELKKGESVTFYIDAWDENVEGFRSWFDLATIDFNIERKVKLNALQPGDFDDINPVDDAKDDKVQPKWSFKNNFPSKQGKSNFFVLWGETLGEISGDEVSRSTDAKQWKGGDEYSTLTPTWVMPGEGVMAVRWVAPGDGVYAINFDWAFDPDGQNQFSGFTGFKVGVLDTSFNDLYKGECVYDKGRVAIKKGSMSKRVEMKKNQSITMYVDAGKANADGARSWFDRATFNFEVTRKVKQGPGPDVVKSPKTGGY